MKNKLVLTWGDIELYVDKLAKMIQGSPDFKKYHSITGIPRGGVIPAIMLSHRLDIPYIELEKTYRFHYPTTTTIIVDDISDSGTTFNRYRHYITVALNMRHTSSFKPMFYADTIQNDDWVVYPWELNSAKTIQGYLDQ